MKNIKYKIIIVFTILLFGLLILNNKVNAASIGMSINKSSCNVGDTFTVTISGINGKVSVSGNSNISMSKSGTIWVEGKETITCTAKSVGTGTVTVTPIDASTTAAEPKEITTSAKRSITIKEKEVQQTPTPTTPTTTKKPTTTTKQEEPKKEVVEDNFYISNITLKGIKENGEQIEVTLSPAFNKDIYEYTCNITGDIQKIYVQKDAGKYTDSIIVKGGEDLQVGENVITLMLAAEDHQAKTYTIKVIKEKQEVVETIAQIEENEQEETKQENEAPKIKMVSMPLWVFIIMQLVIIVTEVLIIYFIPWKKILKIKK